MKKLSFLALPLLVAANPAARADSLLLTGYDVGRWASYGYAGAIVAPDLGAQGWRARIWAEHLRYQYLADGRTIQADAHGGRLSGGYQWSRPSGYTSVYAGTVWRDTRLPDGVASDLRGSQASLALDIEHRQALSDGSTIDAIVSVQARHGNYWSRLRWRRPAGTVQWGPEVLLAGSTEYRAGRLGIGASLPLGDRVGLDASLGYSHNRDLSDGGYAGVGLTMRF